MGPSLGPTRGVSQASTNPPFHTIGIYNTFLGAQTYQIVEYCEIFWTHGNVLSQFFWPSTKFERTLVMLDHFWEFDRLVKDEALERSRDRVISPILQAFWDFRVYVIGMGCRPMVLPMFRPLL
jgi:hypothetical protein